MGAKLIIQVDSSTSQEEAKKCAGLILAFAGFEDSDTTEAEPNPAEIFGQPSQEGQVSTAGPHLVLPEPQAPPPPPPSTAVIPNAPIVPPSGGAIVDSQGLPWDSRIHASSKARNADGSWRIKRGVDKTQIETVNAELHKVMAVPTTGPQLVPAPPPPPPPNVQAIPTPPPEAANAEARAKYIALIGRVSAAKGAGQISNEQITKALGALGVDTIVSLGHRLDLVETAGALLDGIIAGVNA